MKPERLEMSGFAPFRNRVEIDFDGLELFALTGPTGSGKSSVIDAMTFSLYGSVARYDRKSVEPVISLGMAETRVRFDFAVEGDRYTAVRVVRRNAKGGATTAEARLLRNEEVVASGAAEVSQAVEEMLGLGLSHFTRSVVLPQGEFASFLHDTPAGQQELVKALLDMGVIDQVRRGATERARRNQALVESAQARMEPLSDATEEAVEAARSRLTRLESMIDDVNAQEESIQSAEAATVAQRSEEESLTRRLESLEGLAVPAEVGRIAESVADAKAKLKQLTGGIAEAKAELDEIRHRGKAMPDPETLESARKWREEVQEAAERLEAVDLETIEADVANHESLAAERSDQLEEATMALDELNRRHAAHALVQGHAAGDPCPVCARPLDSDPEPAPVDLGAARSRRERAHAQHAEALSVLKMAERSMIGARAEFKAVSERLDRLERRRTDFPALDLLDDLGRQRKELDQSRAAIEDRLARVEQTRVAAEQQLDGLANAEKEAWDGYATARDGVAQLEPPRANRDDLKQSWCDLVEWASKLGERLEQEKVRLKAGLDAEMKAIEKQRSELIERLAEAGVDGDGPPSSRVAAAVATAAAAAERIDERRTELIGLQSDVKRFGEAMAVANTLDNHLKANQFQSWLLAEALESLLDGANHLLAQLTGDAYSLVLESRSIEVVDHRNADERRSVRSLSGGETFLVSLALALSLGEQLINLSNRGGAKLEAIFLDEGFGTLDPETLETVAAVVTELATTGRMVGVVTHVKDLAEQIPVRFEVRPGPGGSTVARHPGEMSA